MGSMIIDKNKATLKHREWAANPGQFIDQCVGSPRKYQYQREGFLSLLKESRVLIKSAHDMGKTFTICDAMLEALYVKGAFYKEAYIIATAPTWNMLKNVLFQELRRKYKKSKLPLGGKLNLTELHLDEKWQLIGFSPRKAVEGDLANFQGFHARLVILVFEEATGIPKSIWNMAEGMTTSANVKLWAIGNPTDPASEFARKFNDFMYTKITWDCYLSPNLIANNIKDINDIKAEVAKVRSLASDEKRKEYINSYKIVDYDLLTLQWVIMRAIEWGIDSPLFQSKVLAQFPTTTTNTLLTIAEVERCFKEYQEGDINPTQWVKHRKFSIGCDPARYGDDNSVIKTLNGNKQINTESWSRYDTTFVYGRIKQQCIDIRNEYGPSEIIIGVDVGGLGAGVVDQLKNDPELAGDQFITIYEYNFGGNALNKEKYVNMISEAAAILRDQIKSPDGFIMSEDYILLGELSNRRFKVDNKTARFWLESKDDYKKRTSNKSPDNADALKMAVYNYYMDGYKSGGKYSSSDTAETHATAYKNREW